MNTQWPTADVDRIDALRVLAALTPGAVLIETSLEASFDEAWQIAADLEHELPRCVIDVRALAITGHEGEHLVAMARGHLGLRARFDVVLRPGWCVMRSRFLLGGMAVVETPAGTRFAFLGGLRFPGLFLMAPALRRLGRPLITRVVSRYAARIAGTSAQRL